MKTIFKMFILLFFSNSCSDLAQSFPVPQGHFYDTIIRNGMIYDGTGRPPFLADIGILRDKIAIIGSLKDTPAHLVIDAKGQAVAPGFINVLSWANESLLYHPEAESDIRQGVTLEILGEGWSMGPLTPDMKRDMQEKAQAAQRPLEIAWTTLGEYMRHLERQGISPNVASFVGATTIRVHTLGYDSRRPTATEMNTMQNLVRQAMREGALGLGSSLIYAPAFYADTQELVMLSAAAGELGGMYASHIRSEGDMLLEAVDEFITIARRANVAAHLHHLKMVGQENWHKADEVISRIHAAQTEEGLKISANMYLYTAGGTGLNAAMPPWVQEGGLASWIRRLKDPVIRTQVIEEMRAPAYEWENLMRAAGPDKTVVIGFNSERLKPYAGKSIAEVARLLGKTPEEAVLDLVIQDHSRVETIYFHMSEENISKLAALPWMSFGSDAAALAPHPPFIGTQPHPRAYGNFARLLGKYVREQQLMTLEDAIRRLTGFPATVFKLQKRGFLKTSYHADIVIFDPQRVQDHATFENPHQFASGISHVFVNGVPVLLEGRHTRARPGRFVKGPGYAP